jgi:hypothetical protein
MEFYQRTFPEDASIVVADHEKLIGYPPGKEIDLKIPIVAPFEKYENTVTVRAVRQGIELREERGLEVFGIAYILTATPIFKNDQVFGALSAIVSNKRFDTLKTNATELSAIVQEIAVTTVQVTHPRPRQRVGIGHRRYK